MIYGLVNEFFNEKRDPSGNHCRHEVQQDELETLLAYKNFITVKYKSMAPEVKCVNKNLLKFLDDKITTALDRF